MTTTPVAPMAAIEMEQAPGPGARTGLVRGLAVAIAVVLAVSVVGLATISPKDGGRGRVLATVLGAAAKTTAAGSARVSMREVVSVSGGASIPAISIDGAQQFTGDKLADLTMHAGSVTLHMLSVGTTGYVEVPARVRQAGGIATPWVSVDISGSAGSSPLTSLGGPTVPGGGDPLATLQALRANGVVKQAIEGDGQTVRGVPTTVYHLVLDAAQFKEAVRQRMKDTPAAGLLDSLQISDPALDLSIDHAGLVRRQVVSLDVTATAGAQSFKATATTTCDLFDFGTPVVAAAPPAAQVTRLSSPGQLFQLFAGSG